MRLKDVPPADYAFAYRDPPTSGNAINGLGEAERRRPRSVFHGTGGEVLDWSALDRLFVALNTWSAMWQSVKNLWVLRNADGPVAERRTPVQDPAAMAAVIKDQGRTCGADLVGITPISDFIRVVLPIPLRPMMATISPGSTVRFRPWRISLSP